MKHESDVEQLLIDACESIGIRCPKGNSTDKGFPDRVIYNVYKGEIYFVEVKNQTYYKQQKTQREWQKHIELSGGKYFLIDGEEEMKQFIRKYIQRGK
jgi:hypothetical protein